jgi:hypothetical protein
MVAAVDMENSFRPVEWLPISSGWRHPSLVDVAPLCSFRSMVQYPQ